MCSHRCHERGAIAAVVAASVAAEYAATEGYVSTFIAIGASHQFPAATVVSCEPDSRWTMAQAVGGVVKTGLTVLTCEPNTRAHKQVCNYVSMHVIFTVKVNILADKINSPFR